MMMPGPDYNPERSLGDQLRAARAENDAIKLQNEAYRRALERIRGIEGDEASWTIAYEALKGPVEKRLCDHDYVRGMMNKALVCDKCGNVAPDPDAR